MTFDYPTNPPAEIVQSLLSKSSEVAAKASRIANQFVAKREELRDLFAKNGLVQKVPNLETVALPSVVGVDGAMMASKKRFGDVCAVVSVAAPVGIGGLSGDDEFVDGAQVWMDVLPRSVKTSESLRTLMSALELSTAAKQDADVVMLDGSFASLLVGVAIGYSTARQLPDYEGKRNPLLWEIDERMADIARDVLTVLDSAAHIALPKYVTTNEFARLGILQEYAGYDAKTLASVALAPGEMTPLVRSAGTAKGSEQKDHLRLSAAFGAATADIVAALSRVRSTFYRPHPWTPAYRIDIGGDCSDDKLLTILKSVSENTAFTEIQEPLPLHFADAWAKQVSVGAAPATDAAMLEGIQDQDIRLMFALDYRTVANAVID